MDTGGLETVCKDLRWRSLKMDASFSVVACKVQSSGSFLLHLSGIPTRDTLLLVRVFRDGVEAFLVVVFIILVTKLVSFPLLLVPVLFRVLLISSTVGIAAGVAGVRVVLSGSRRRRSRRRRDSGEAE
jgi:hypothetical protein